MSNATCFVPECNSGYTTVKQKNKSLGIKNPSRFRAPKDPVLLDKWRHAIPRADRILSEKDVVCEHHFTESDIKRFYETKLSDGTVFKLEMGRPRLQEGAIPSIFPNLPSYLSKPSCKRKAPAARNVPANKKNAPLVADNVATSEKDFTFPLLTESLQKISKPHCFWTVNSVVEFIVCARWTANYMCEKRVIIDKDMTIKAFLKDRQILISKSQITSIEDLAACLEEVECYVICRNIDREENCLAYAGSVGVKRGPKTTACQNCIAIEKKAADRQRLKKKRMELRKRSCKQHKIMKTRYKNIVRKNVRLVRKLNLVKMEMENIKKKCAQANKDAVKDILSSLPSKQQISVEACIAAAKVSGKGMRYTVQWVYECLLLKIKSRKAYKHLRENNILALPCINTFNRYIRRIKGVYGFQDAIFDSIRIKTANMSPPDRHGILLLDEMKVSPFLVFDRTNLRVQGFTDLGDFTPDHQKEEQGDHVLVFMFQPFKGKWVQAVACFLSKGAASGSVLHHLIVEGVLLLEKAGLFIDGITTDGATWNRNMWKQFGISDKNTSCEHMCDPNRRLWFLSDFPHLIKNVRNCICVKQNIVTPDGLIQLKHWEAIIALDNPRGFNLKLCPRLTPDHVHPKNSQKMNVAMAFQFFSESVASGMEIYKDQHDDLKDCNSTITFIRKFNCLIDAMNSRIPATALKFNSPEHKVIQDFLEYIKKWEMLGKTNFLSESTCRGLKITLESTLQLFEYLSVKCGFEYLMTSRLNQDSLEVFFGMMRSACGSNDHPDSAIFLQVYRLISTYSLIKPNKGCSTASSEVLSSLLEIGEMTSERKKIWSDQLDSILDGGKTELIEEALESDHTYSLQTTSDFIISYIAGYIARRVSRFSKCNECVNSLKNNRQDNLEKKDKLIALKSKGHLIYPSDALFCLILQLEETTMKVLSSERVHVDTLFKITSALENGPPIQLIGCNDHLHSFTNSILRFFLITQMYFVCKRVTNIDRNRKTKELRKLSKLT